MDGQSEMIEFDGMMIPVSLYEEIKDIYCDLPTIMEYNAYLDCMQITRNAIMMIDEILGEEGYEPEKSSKEFWEVAQLWVCNPYVADALKNDEVLITQLLEVLGGVKSQEHEQEIQNVIALSSLMIQKTERSVMH